MLSRKIITLRDGRNISYSINFSQAPYLDLSSREYRYDDAFNPVNGLTYKKEPLEDYLNWTVQHTLYDSHIPGIDAYQFYFCLDANDLKMPLRVINNLQTLAIPIDQFLEFKNGTLYHIRKNLEDLLFNKVTAPAFRNAFKKMNSDQLKSLLDPFVKQLGYYLYTEECDEMDLTMILICELKSLFARYAGNRFLWRLSNRYLDSGPLPMPEYVHRVLLANPKDKSFIKGYEKLLAINQVRSLQQRLNPDYNLLNNLKNQIENLSSPTITGILLALLAIHEQTNHEY